MSLNKTIETHLRKMSILDISLIKTIYLLLGFLIAACYPKLLTLDWQVYLIVMIITVIPFLLGVFGEKEQGYIKKAMKFLSKKWTPAHQVLLLLYILSVSFILAIFFPVLSSFSFESYLVVIILLMIKPFYNIWLKK